MKLTWTTKVFDISELKPYGKNPRTISNKQFIQLKEKIESQGYHNRILAQPDGAIIGGHQRYSVLKESGIKEIECLIPSRPLTEKEFRKLNITDNINDGDWNWEILANDFDSSELLDWGFDKKFLPDLKKTFDDEAADAETALDTARIISQPGDVWILGNHRLMCGDSTIATDVEKLLAGVKPHLMVTDPPYGVEYDASWREGASAKGKVINDDKADWREAWALFHGDVVYIWHASLHTHEVAESLVACEFDLRANIIWAKNQIAIGRGHYHWQHEPCWYAVKKGATGHWAGDRKQTTLWQIDKPQKSETGHSTQKPVECMRRPMINNSSEGQAIYEPFSGSGTTIIAAEQTGRHCYAMELSETYVDMAVRRWQKFTDKNAILEGTGETFDEKSAEIRQ